jgi:hypothetical protein
MRKFYLQIDDDNRKGGCLRERPVAVQNFAVFIIHRVRLGYGVRHEQA